MDGGHENKNTRNYVRVGMRIQQTENLRHWIEYGSAVQCIGNKGITQQQQQKIQHIFVCRHTIAKRTKNKNVMEHKGYAYLCCLLFLPQCSSSATASDSTEIDSMGAKDTTNKKDSHVF